MAGCGPWICLHDGLYMFGLAWFCLYMVCDRKGVFLNWFKLSRRGMNFMAEVVSGFTQYRNGLFVSGRSCLVHGIGEECLLNELFGESLHGSYC